jgi:hypothetical protein
MKTVRIVLLLVCGGLLFAVGVLHAAPLTEITVRRTT